jgi:hypothetical protein
MTMLDDDVLSNLFARAAESLAVPETGPADILRRANPSSEAEGDEADPAAPVGPEVGNFAAVQARRLTRTMRAHRVLTVAACLVLAVAIAGGVGALTARNQSPGVSSLAVGRHSIAPIPTTTVPASGKFAVPAAGGSSGSPTGPANNFSVNATAGGQLATGANSGHSTQGAASASAPSTATSTPSTSPLPQGLSTSARIEQTGSLTLTVPKGAFAKTMTELTFLATAYNGFVASTQSQSSSGPGASGSITLQVPVTSFSAVLKKAQSLGRTDSLTTMATNVTGQYVNLQERITAAQDSLQQYLTIMSKATSIGDVLSVQSQIDSIQSDIEQLQGQLQLLSSQTTYSTLTIEFSQRTPVVHQHHPAPHHPSGLDTAWHNSVHGFVDGVEGLIRLAGPALFVLICAAAVIVGGRVSWRRYQRHIL